MDHRSGSKRYVALAVERRRGERNVISKEKRRKRRRRLSGAGPEEYRKYVSKVLNLFAKYEPDIKKLRKGRQQSFKLPRHFSLSENSAECLKIFSRIVEYARGVRRPKILLDHRQIEKLGLGADSVLGMILKEIQKEHRGSPGAYIRGLKPRKEQVKKIMDEVGCVRVLLAETEDDIQFSLQSTSKVYRHRSKETSIGHDPLALDPISSTTADYVDHLNDCLAVIRRRLSPSGRERFCEYVGEVLSNAVDHSGLNDWTIVGYIDPDDRGLTYRSVIFSFGKTVAQTFKALDKGSFAWKAVEPYLVKHQQGAFFSSDWCEDDLLSVVALQGDISSKNTDSSTDRGQGTVDLISFFQEVKNECGQEGLPAVMHILTGSTQISFHGPYQMQYSPTEDRMIIAFNEFNDLYTVPDKRNVRHLSDAFFPGVLVSVAIPLVGSTVESAGDSGYED